MPLDTWLTIVAAATLLVAIPGPTVLLVLSYALSKGRSVAVACALGVAVGDFIAMSLSLAGLGALVMRSAVLFGILKWAGAAYLVWLGLRLLRSASTAPTAPVPPPAAGGVFGHAAAVTALNPKSIAFFIAFVPQFVDPGQPAMPQFAILIASFVSIAALNALVYALAADRLRGFVGHPGVLAWITRAGGSALIAMGVLAATLRRA